MIEFFTSSTFQTVLAALNSGFLKTLQLFFITLIGALPLGLIISFGSMNRWAPLGFLRKPGMSPLLNWLLGLQPISLVCRLLVWIIRGSPLMLQLLLVYYGPGMLGYNIWGTGSSGRFAAAMAAFILNYACYFSEIFRGGIESIPKGQYEAAQVLGMTKSQCFFKVILLQVVKRIVPPLSNEIITLVKDTSLARIIAVREIIMEAQVFIKKGFIWPLFYSGAFYLIFCGLLTILFHRIEKGLDYFRV